MNRKRVTLKEIALEAGVSPTAVSLVINGRRNVHIAEETRRRIIVKARELGYDLNPPKAIGSPSGEDLPVILYFGSDRGTQNIGTSFFSNLTREIKKRSAGVFNFLDVTCDFDNLPAQIRYFMQSQPRLIVTPRQDIYSSLRSHGIQVPVIIPQGMPEDVEGDDKAAVYMVDDCQVGRLAAEELVAGGSRHCAMIFPAKESRSIIERLDSFTEEFQEKGGIADHLLVNDYSPESIDDLFSNTPPTDFDCFFCYSDALALYLIRYLMKQGFSLPGNASVIGADNLYWGAHIYPSLTTMDLTEEAMADRIVREAEDLLRERAFIAGSQRFPVSLIKRESTR